MSKLPNPKLPCPRCDGTGEVWANHIGPDLRERRKRAGKSLREVAEKLGVSIVYLSDVERANRSINGVREREYMEALR